MYKIKRVKGSLPKSLKGLYFSYNQVRSALRKYLRKQTELPSGVHLTVSEMRIMGFDIIKA
jgi:hypothetical protein